MNVIILCEESQIVCEAFLKKGNDAYSCDTQECSGIYPLKHIKADARTVDVSKFDLIISHPPCDDLALCGARWFKEKRLSGSQERSINFFLDMWEISNCIENPKNIMSGWKYLKQWFPVIIERMLDIKFPIKFSQSVQPYQFGHGETKETWLWLRGLPLLKETNPVAGRENRIWKMPPSKDRAKLRSKTFTGIAEAMANQWG